MSPKQPLKRATMAQKRAHARWLLNYPMALSGPPGVPRAAAADADREEEERFALEIIERTLTWALREAGEGNDPVVWARRQCERRAAARVERARRARLAG